MKSPLADQGAGSAHFDGQGSLVKLPEPEQKPKPMAMDQLFYKLGKMFTSEDLLASMIEADLKEAGYPEYAHQFMSGQADSGQVLADVRCGKLSPNEAREELLQKKIKFDDRFIYLKDGTEYTVSHCMGSDQTLVFRTADIDDHILVDNKTLLDSAQFKRVNDSQADEIKVGDRFKATRYPRELFTIVDLKPGDMARVEDDCGAIPDISIHYIRSALKRGNLKRLTPKQQIDELMTREGV